VTPQPRLNAFGFAIASKLIQYFVNLGIILAQIELQGRYSDFRSQERFRVKDQFQAADLASL